MIDRCYLPKHGKFPIYGGRGIKVCYRWHRFENFLEDMGVRPIGFTIERKDNAGMYTLSNCKWASLSEQSLNRRPHGFSKYKGVSWCSHRNKWRASIRIEGHLIQLGRFTDELEAAEAHKQAKIAWYGEAK